MPTEMPVGWRYETTDDRCPLCGSDFSVTVAGAVQVGNVWRDERECLTCGQHFRRLIIQNGSERRPR